MPVFCDVLRGEFSFWAGFRASESLLKSPAWVWSMRLNLPSVHLIASCLCVDPFFSSARKTCLLGRAAHIPSCAGQSKHGALLQQLWFESLDLYLVFEAVFWNRSTFCSFSTGTDFGRALIWFCPSAALQRTNRCHLQSVQVTGSSGRRCTPFLT